MVTTLSRGELLAVECHTTSMLQQLSTHTTTKASVFTSNGQVKSGNANTGAVVNFYFNSVNACYCSMPQTNSRKPHNKFKVGAAICANDLIM